MPQETKSDRAFVREKEQSLQGLVATREDERALLDALEKAFDYRGDCTITTAGGDAVTGYIFDRRRGETLDASTLRLMTPDSDEHVTVRFSEIARLEFTGRDTAHGKSFETWVNKFIEKKLAGESASLESESLDD
jgi:hypothetical protein